MKLRNLLSAAILAAGFAVSAQGALSPAHQEWARGPVQFLMTKQEAAKWKTVVTDDEATAFVNLFWARRDPTPGTPRNEFHEQFDARVAYANDAFAAGERVSGAMSDRGKALIVFGVPRGSSSSGGNRSQFDRSIESSRIDVNWIDWEYQGPETKAIFGGDGVASIRFVDRYGIGEYKFDRGFDFAAAQERAIERIVVQPELTAAPTSATSEAPANVLSAASLSAAIDQAKTSTQAPTTFVSWGEYVTSAGETFVPVSLYVAVAAGIDDTRTLTFFGVVQDESGKNVLTFEEPAKLVATKGNFYVDHTVKSLAAGKYRGWFGLAENGKPLTLASADMQVSGALDKDAAGVSQLLLSNDVYPLRVAQNADDPFAFGGLKIVPKSDRTFRTSDDLWYFVELRNPGVAEPTGDIVPIVGAPVAVPRIQVRLDVEGTDAAGNRKRMQAPLREVDVLALKDVRGRYGVGNSLPLATFKPGDYTFTMKIIDTVTKASYTLTEKFRITE